MHRQRLLAINETLAFLSHELNTPLATIVNFTHGIKNVISSVNSQPQPVPRENLIDIERANSSIQDSALYCLKLLSSLVTSVHHTGNMSRENSENSAIQLVTSMLDTFSLTQRQRACINIEKAEDFTINALPNIVSLVLSYVIGNALKAVEGRAGPSILITICEKPSPQICITDNGRGINPALITRLSHDPITSHSTDGGKGWGLILSTRIMQAIGGCLTVTSERNEGTTIVLKFPAESEYLN
ncbi:MAG: HAMP domain-containing histidine kinase [Moraxellaceae bacterium]|nr:MAG: HAMP domain-containing histidine kinase [Moraxellaceae bacterium]